MLIPISVPGDAPLIHGIARGQGPFALAVFADEADLARLGSIKGEAKVFAELIVLEAADAADEMFCSGAGPGIPPPGAFLLLRVEQRRRRRFGCRFRFGFGWAPSP
jgi:hypothetical protein